MTFHWIIVSFFWNNIISKDIKIPKTIYKKGDQEFDITNKVKELFIRYTRKPSNIMAPSIKLLGDKKRLEVNSSAPFSYVISFNKGIVTIIEISSQVGESEKTLNKKFIMPKDDLKFKEFIFDEGIKLIIKDSISEAREEAKETYRRL